jgi:hypothetical protein
MILGFLAGAAIAISAVISLAGGRTLSPPEMVLVVLGAGLLAISVRYLRPGRLDRIRQRYEAALRSAGDDRFAAVRRVLRRSLLITILALAIEIPVASLVWSAHGWQPFIAIVIGTTLLTAIFSGVIFIRGRPASEL